MNTIELNKVDMDVSTNNHRNILDLPNELLLIIFKKLNLVDVLFSLVNVTERFDQLILHPLYIRHLDMTSMAIKSYHNRIYSLDNEVLDRICQNILPRIHHQVNELVVEQQTMEHVLNHSVTYPQLHFLSLLNFEEEVLRKALTGTLSFSLFQLTQSLNHET